MQRVRLWAVAVVSLGVAAGCSTPNVVHDAVQPVCLPGQQVACACPGGLVGAQVCRDDGQGLDPCQCPDGGTPRDDTIVGNRDQELDTGADSPGLSDLAPDGRQDTAPDVSDAAPDGDSASDPDMSGGQDVLPDAGPPEGQRSYRFDRLAFATPGLTQHTRFADLLTQILDASFTGGAIGPDTLFLLAIFSETTSASSAVDVTLCQGVENADHTVSCGSTSPAAATTATLDGAGNVTTAPTTFSFVVDIPGGSLPLTLLGLTLQGQLRPTAKAQQPPGPADSPIGRLTNGQFTGQLRVADVCSVNLSNNALGTLCDGVTDVNLLDLLDGPDANCGQDASANTSSCTASADAAGHNPPTGGAYTTGGAFDLTGVEYTP
jgi:hypothetical protein